MIVVLFAIALGLSAGNQPQIIQRHNHDHTIYTVQGSADQLAKFQSEIGSQWAGGLLIDTKEKTGQYRYWAFSERTAPQARQFILGSIMLGLQLDIEAYDETRFFPAERSELDAIALKCGYSVDPFFITPTRELQIGAEPSATFTAVDCALKELNASKILSQLPTGLVGNEAPAEKVK